MKYGMFFALVVLTQVVVAFPCQAKELGEGYSCTDGKVFKKNKEVSVKKAKTAIQNKITNLGGSKKNKAKRNALKAVKTAIGACPSSAGGGGNGTELTGNIDDISAGPLDTGTFNGTYTLNGVTYGAQFRIDDRGFKIAYGLKLVANPYFLATQKEFFFDSGSYISIPAEIAASVDNSAFETLQNVTALGNVSSTVRKFTGKQRDEFRITVVTDNIPAGNRVDPNAARFEITFLSEVIIGNDYKFSGTCTVFNDAGGVLSSGPIVMIKPD